MTRDFELEPGEKTRTVTLKGGPSSGVVMKVPSWFNHLKIHQPLGSYDPNGEKEATTADFRVGWYRAEAPGKKTLVWTGWEK